ncbi:MAG: hypothetical protein AAF664_21045 [Planctomycetota bacterium]
MTTSTAKRFTCSVWFFLTGSLVPMSASRAELMYSFGQSNYNVEVNGRVIVDVFLTQTSPGVFDLAVDGLESAGVRVSSDLNAPSDPARVLSVNDIAANPVFDGTFPPPVSEVVGSSSAGLVRGLDFGSPVPTGIQILLGSFTFTAGSVPGQITSLVAGDFSAETETVGGDATFTPLDSMIGSGFATITTVTAVPEPSSLVLCATLIVISLTRGRRRSRA